MLTPSLITLLIAASAASAPLYPRLVTLDPAATAEAQRRDDTATRAFSDTTIKTGDGRCLQVTSGTGDFRENLAPIQVANCDGSKGQQFDVITKGAHNDQADSALIVSSLTQACFNFDPRRAAGNTVITFSCGGRADGGGQVTNSQLFTFKGGAGPLSLAPENAQGQTCFAVRGNVIDSAPCAAGASDQTFTFGAQASAPQPPAQSSAPPAATSSATSSASAPAATSTRALTKLDPAGTAEAQKRDNTATRAFSDTSIKTGDGRCLQVTSGAGDFRENLAPIEVAACDGSKGQQFDVITKGVHNDRADSALIVSSLTQACFNFDPRRAAGNTVITFSCGGRADGGGQVTDSQLFTFKGGAGPLSLAPENAQSKTCFAVRGNVIDSAPCSAGAADQTFTFGAQASAPQPPAQSSQAAATTSAVATTSASAPAATSTRALTKLDPAGTAEAQKRDDTATRAFSNTAIKTGDGRCLQVTSGAGDFRENLAPIEVAACDGSKGQQFDVITKGVHNDRADSALVVSSLTQACFNFDPRRAAGNTVITFSCGGRADGGGQVTDSQLFTFKGGAGPLALAPENAQGKTCFAVRGNVIDSAPCAAGDASQTFTFA